MNACQHDRARSSESAFVELTVRLPHRPDEESFQEYRGQKIWLRNCPNCSSTICMEVTQ